MSDWAVINVAMFRRSRRHFHRPDTIIAISLHGNYPMRTVVSFTARRCTRRFHRVVLVAAAVIAATISSGCAGDTENDPNSAPASGSATAAARPALVADKGKDQAPGQSATAPRKIIYDARVELLVENLATAEELVLKLIKEHDGFLAESDQTSMTSSQRRATWRVRVPVDHFDPFLAAVSRLGQVKQNHIGSQDVTEEYFDVEARIHNKQEEEKRLLKHLSESTGKLEEILAVERELSRVRGEIEQMQGRHRYLADRTELSTINIDAIEWKDYKPPAAVTFPTQLSDAFFRSVDNLVSFGRSLLIFAVALAPWLPFIVLGVMAARWLVRASRNLSNRQPLPTASPRPGAT
jgi:hypothetical protein